MPKLIDGVAFEITSPYSAGHVCTEVEAKVLNQVRAENIGNNVRAKVKELHGQKKMAEAQAYVREVDEKYTFTASGAASRKLEPVEREARALAKSIVADHLAKTGRKIGVPPAGETEESWADKIEANIETLMVREDIVLLARKRLADKSKVIAEGVAGLG